MTGDKLRQLGCEAFGTFVLVFAGTAAIVVNDTTGAITHVGVALTFGLVVLVLVAALGDVSGAHLNPAVTLGFVLAGRFPRRQLGPYVLAQVGGAFAASGLLGLLYPDHPGLGGTHPAGPVGRSFVFELVLTLILMVIVLAISAPGREIGRLAGMVVGAVIGLEALFAGPECGASMNPARSLAPAVVSGQAAGLWVYLTAPPLGAALAVPIAWALFPPSSPRTDDAAPPPVRVRREQ